MTIKKDSLAPLRAIVEKHGWKLCSTSPGYYRVKRDDRLVIWCRHGNGFCNVEWLGARVGYHIFLPTLGDKRPTSPREEFAEAILSAYSDEKFVAAAHARLEGRAKQARQALTIAEEAFEQFKHAVVDKVCNGPSCSVEAYPNGCDDCPVAEYAHD